MHIVWLRQLVWCTNLKLNEELCYSPRLHAKGGLRISGSNKESATYLKTQLRNKEFLTLIAICNAFSGLAEKG